MALSPQTKISNNEDPVNYKSFETLRTRHIFTDSQDDYDGNADLNNPQKEFPDKQLASGKPDQAVVKERQDTLMQIYVTCIIFAIAVTIAMILHIHLGKTPDFDKGGLVSDHELCTAIGQKVLDDRGSSVDAAIAATLCLGIVYPHMSGIGGGGLMLIHDIRQNEAKVVNFLETAPHNVKDDIMQSDLELKPGLQVGVPGVLRGLHTAHDLYGRMPWADVVKRAAAVARDGFNVSLSLSASVAKVKDEKLSGQFRSVFFPDGQAVLPDTFLRLPGLATVLEAGLSNFYMGNLSREIEEEVRASGGVLSREDMANYIADVEKPVEGHYLEYKVLVPPPPSIGAALISTLGILDHFNLTQNDTTSVRTYHWIAESLKAALSMASGLGNPNNTDLLAQMLSKSHSEALARQMAWSPHASAPERVWPVPRPQGELAASQVTVAGPDGVVVSVASSLSRPFGSKILTPSGVLLNSRLLHFFSWPSRGQGSLPTSQRNRVQPGKRPLSGLMPTIVVPHWQQCGFYMALGNSDGVHSLSGITQVLINILYYHKNINDSLSLGRLHPQLQPNTLLVDSAFPEADVEGLREVGHIVHRVEALSVVSGIQRSYASAITSAASWPA